MSENKISFPVATPWVIQGEIFHVRDANDDKVLDRGTFIYTSDMIAAIHAVNNHLKLIEALQLALEIIDEQVYIPESCGMCGHPDACCDGDCMTSSYMNGDIGKIKDILRRAKNINTLEVEK